MMSRENEIKKQKKLGRPVLGDLAATEAVTIRFPVALLAQIDERRALMRPIPTRPAMIRELVEAALENEFVEAGL